jgi:hypothetical protein
MDYQLNTKGLKIIRKLELISLLSLFNKHHQHHIKNLVAITVMGMVGIEMTSLCLSSVPLVCSNLALSGTLQNFAGRVIIFIKTL